MVTLGFGLIVRKRNEIGWSNRGGGESPFEDIHPHVTGGFLRQVAPDARLMAKK